VPLRAAAEPANAGQTPDKIVELAEILHEPVEHECLRISNGADSKRGNQELQGLALTANP
jgi:hypothetical protein